MIAALKSRYFVHEDGLQKSVESYQKTLLEGMEDSEPHIDLLLREPHNTSALAR